MASEPPSPARPPRAFEEIAQQIRARIAAGELKAGDKLPPEREMAEKFQVGRNAIREALRTLEMAGVLRLEKGRSGGAYIRPANASRMTVAMQDMMDYGSIELDELTQARISIMELITREACERGTAGDFDAIEHNIDETEAVTEAGNLDRRAELAAEFYTLVARSTHNRVLAMLVTSLSQILPRLIQARVHAVSGTPGPALVAARRKFLRHLRARDSQRAFGELRAQMLEGHRLVASALDKPEKAEKAEKTAARRKRA
jgi:DNA-binding FadR family transcriptional regulator